MVKKRPRSGIGRHADDGSYSLNDDADADMVRLLLVKESWPVTHLPTLLSALTGSLKVQQMHATDLQLLQDPYEGYAEVPADPTGWSDAQVSEFFDAFQAHGQDWYKVSREVGRPAQQCAALHKQHSLYLNLASQLIQKEAFMGMVRSSQEHNPQVSKLDLDTPGCACASDHQYAATCRTSIVLSCSSHAEPAAACRQCTPGQCTAAAWQPQHFYKCSCALTTPRQLAQYATAPFEVQGACLNAKGVMPVMHSHEATCCS